MLIGCVWASSAQLGRQGDGEPSFEVVSVKYVGSSSSPDGPTNGRLVHRFDFRFSGRHLTFRLQLDEIVKDAFGLRDWELVAPDWLSENVYEVNALMPEGAGKAEAASMVQTMLKERFALKCHRESRDLPVSVILVGKRGFPLHEAIQTGHTTLQSPNRRDGKIHLVGTEVPLASLAKYLTFATGRTVIDGTGLRGAYDFDIAWTPDYDPESASIDRAAAPAIEQALDIRLEPRKASARVLVIDYIAKTPTAN